LPHIDLPADLNFVDDDGLTLARVPDTGAPKAGAVLAAGTPTAWSWVVVEDVDDVGGRFRPTAAPGWWVCPTSSPSLAVLTCSSARHLTLRAGVHPFTRRTGDHVSFIATRMLAGGLIPEGSHRGVTRGGAADVPNACASLYPRTAIVHFHSWPSTSGLLPASRGQRAATSCPPPRAGGPSARWVGRSRRPGHRSSNRSAVRFRALRRPAPPPRSSGRSSSPRSASPQACSSLRWFHMC